MKIKTASGFGDALYFRPIVKHFCKTNNDITVLTDYPDVYFGLRCKTNKYNYDKPDHKYTYVHRKQDQSTSQYEDILLECKIKDELPYNLDIKTKEMCLINNPYYPMNEVTIREELMPNYRILQSLINKNKDKYYYILVGNQGKFKYELEGIDIDLRDKTPIPLLFDLIKSSRMIISQIGWMIAAAEGFNKRIMVVFAGAGLKSTNKFYNSITPKKVITKSTSAYCVDDEPIEDIQKRIEVL